MLLFFWVAFTKPLLDRLHYPFVTCSNRSLLPERDPTRHQELEPRQSASHPQLQYTLLVQLGLQQVVFPDRTLQRAQQHDWRLEAEQRELRL